MDRNTPNDSTVFAVLRETRIVNRETFEIPTLDPWTGRVDGSISAHDFAARMLAAFGHGPDDQDEDEDQAAVAGTA